MHGLKRIRERYGWSVLSLQSGRVRDPRLMAYLLNPGLDKQHRYDLDSLMYEYTGSYPYAMAPNLKDFRYPDWLGRCLRAEAECVLRLAPVLWERMGAEQQSLYRELELPVSDVLVRMHLEGIGVDGAACSSKLDQARSELEALESSLSRRHDLGSGRGAYWFLVDRGVKLPERMAAMYDLDQDDLEELALNEPLAGQVLDYRRLKRDLGFLEAAAGQERIHPVWRQSSHANGRITAVAPPVQNISRQRYRPLLVPRAGSGTVDRRLERMPVALSGTDFAGPGPDRGAKTRRCRRSLRDRPMARC